MPDSFRGAQGVVESLGLEPLAVFEPPMSVVLAGGVRVAQRPAGVSESTKIQRSSGCALVEGDSTVPGAAWGGWCMAWLPMRLVGVPEGWVRGNAGIRGRGVAAASGIPGDHGSRSASNSAAWSANPLIRPTRWRPPPTNCTRPSASEGIRGTAQNDLRREYLSDPDYRRKISRQLNKRESLHAWRRDLLYAHEGMIRARHLESQTEQAWCSTLATNAVIAWTAEYYGLAVEQMRQEGRRIDDEVLAHVSPGHSENINSSARSRSTSTPNWAGWAPPATDRSGSDDTLF